VEGSPLGAKTNYGYRVYYGVNEQGEAPPPTGKYLRLSKFTRQKKTLFTFEPEDAGRTAYFCIRYENSRGEPEPWVGSDDFGGYSVNEKKAHDEYPLC
jgi:hypothetical protein